MNKQSTTPTTKKTKHQSTKPPFYKRKWVIVCAIAILILSISVIAPRWYKSNQDKKQAQARTDAIDGIEKAIAATVGLRGEVIFVQHATDVGCGTTERGWFGYETTCSYVGKVVIKNNQSSEIDRKLLEEKFVSVGYLESDAGNLDNMSDNAIINPLIFDKKEMQPQDPTTPKSLFGLDKDVPLAPNEYLYGIVVTAKYHTSYPWTNPDAEN